MNLTLSVKAMLGIITAILSIAALVPYVRDVYLHKTKPHAISWFIWGTVAGIVAVAQLVKGGGAGAWVNVAVAIFDTAIFVLSLKHGEKHIVLFDWLCLAAAAVAIVLWGIVHDPTIAVILVTIVDVAGFLPTIRKVHAKPFEETKVTYIMYVLIWSCSIFALQAYNIATVLDPAALLLMNIITVVLISVQSGRVKQYENNRPHTNHRSGDEGI